MIKLPDIWVRVGENGEALNIVPRSESDTARSTVEHYVPADRISTLERERDDLKAQLVKWTRENNLLRMSLDAEMAGHDERASKVLEERALRESAEQQVRALREALRVYALLDHGYQHGYQSSCAECGERWGWDKQEVHAPGCLAALAQQ